MDHLKEAPDYLQDDHLSRGTKAYLKVLNGGAPVESLPVGEARRVLADVQAAVHVDLSGIEESERTVESEGHTLRLNLVRPSGGGARVSSGVRVHSRRGLGAGRLSHPQAAGARPCRGVGLCGGIRQLYSFARGAFSEGCRGGVCRSEMGGRKRPGDRGRRQPAGAGGQQRRR